MAMDQEVAKLKQLIEDSERIFITSHISPDADAVSSVLLMGTTLKQNFPDKKLLMALEEEPDGLEFLEGYQGIKFGPAAGILEEFKPDLFILLDANNYERASRLDGPQVRSYIDSNGVKSAVIDHHEEAGKDAADVYINQRSPAVVQDIYEILFGKYGLSQPPGFAQTAMTGLYSDTGGFAYDNPRHTETFKLADELVSAGANVELIRNKLYRYSEADMEVLSALSGNISKADNYTYSFLSDDFVGSWISSGKTGAQLNSGTQAFVNGFLRNIDGRQWGFIVYKNPLAGDSMYSVSLRSVGGVKDVAQVASKLGGGGHKPAAGAKFPAANLYQALAKVKQAINA